MIDSIDLSILINLILIYYAFILIYGLIIGIRAILRSPRRLEVNLNQKYLSVNPRFLVLIPAHNEENVVSYLIKDILTQNYNPNYFRALVVADKGDPASVFPAINYLRLTCLDNAEIVVVGNNKEYPRGTRERYNFSVINPNRFVGGSSRALFRRGAAAAV